MPARPELLGLVPDEPRWVEARAMLLAGAPAVEVPGGWLVHDAGAQLTVVLGDADAGEVVRRLGGGTVLCARERDDLVRALRLAAFAVEHATLHTLPDPATLGDDDGIEPLDPRTTDLGHLPPALADELRRATSPVHAAWVDGRPVGFAYAPWRTERWFDVSVDTLAGARQLGLATRTASAMIRAERALGREPVWGAADSNAASLRLAARLGFVAIDGIVVATR
jgi:hypothetical protein